MELDRKEYLYSEIREHLPYLSEAQLEKIYKVIFNKTIKNPERQKMRTIFLKGYKQYFKADYYWTAKDSAALSQLHSKIKSRSDEGGSQFIVDSFRAYLNQALQDKWISEHFDMSILNSQFNKIYRNGLNRKETTDTTRKEFEQWLGS